MVSSRWQLIYFAVTSVLIQFRFGPTIKPFCHFWYKDLEFPVIIQVTEFSWAGPSYEWSFPHDGKKKNILNPYVLGCKAPILENDSIPTSVSLMNVNCSDEAPSNNILINYVDR